MFMARGALTLFISLALGYALCVVAHKQKGLLKTVGYTLGISIMALSLLYSAVESSMIMCMQGKCMIGGKSIKCPAGMFMKGRVK